MHIPDDARNKYLLSATAQVLGAVFALVFSISLIATQFVSKYTHRPAGVIFHKKIFIYMGGFAVAVVFPLWWIVTPIGIGSFLSLVLGSLFVLSVPVFFLYLIKMNIEGVISELKRIGLRDVEIGNEERARKMIKALDNIAMGAYTDRNFEVFELAVTALTDLTLEVNQEQLRKVIFEKLRDTCEELIDNPRAPRIIIKKLGKVGAHAIVEWLKSSNITDNTPSEEIEKEIPQTAENAVNIIMVVAEACEKENQARLLFACVVALGEMLNASSLRYLRDRYTPKVESVCKRFKDKKWVRSWYNKARKHISSLGITP